MDANALDIAFRCTLARARATARTLHQRETIALYTGRPDDAERAGRAYVKLCRQWRDALELEKQLSRYVAAAECEEVAA